MLTSGLAITDRMFLKTFTDYGTGKILVFNRKVYIDIRII